MKISVKLKRYNIYSGIEITSQGISICVDPAKITPMMLKQLEPDIILISHESMDHMDPVQVYVLQKKKNAKIYCSIAAAVDLMNYYPSDVDFIDNINILLPYQNITFNGVKISGFNSVHCDYMFPMIFKIEFLENKISILHTIDSLLSDEVIEASKNTDISIIPIGIAKGVDVQMGLNFINSLYSKIFVTNHFTTQLEKFKESVAKVNTNKEVVFLDWTDEHTIAIIDKETTINKNETKAIDNWIQYLSVTDDLNARLNLFASSLSIKKYSIINKEVVNKLIELYDVADRDSKTLIITIFEMFVLYKPSEISDGVLNIVHSAICEPAINEGKDILKASGLLFIALYAQKTGKAMYVSDIAKLVDIENEYLSYWVVECLGRMIAFSVGDSDVVDKFYYIINQKDIYNSVIVRRRIFWELNRIARATSAMGEQFGSYFMDGLVDVNPDVRLLALLCIGVVSRTTHILSEQIFEKMIVLENDEEDDVRETLARLSGMINRYNHEFALGFKDTLVALKNDVNEHVRRAASEALVELLSE